jgi:uncharacterized protein (TIGR00255 family)
MNSMTGYGRGEASSSGMKLAVELSSVNRKQGEIFVSLPRELEVLESRIRDVINQQISRGRTNVKVTLQSGNERSAGKVHLNTEVARQYLKEVKRLSRELKMTDLIPLETLLRSPGVVEFHTALEEPEKLWIGVRKALIQGLDAMLKMRTKEGAHLAKDLAKRVTLIQKSVALIRNEAPKVSVRYREALRERIQSAGLEIPGVEEERLIKEVVYFADRSDITEELTRLESHFKQFDDCIHSTEPVGRKLDFLVQEMNREINTIGSKANDSTIAKHVINVKAELERFREQALNVE